MTSELGGREVRLLGTTALNAVTYLDMAVRRRASSSTPEDTVEALSSNDARPRAGGPVLRPPVESVDIQPFATATD